MKQQTHDLLVELCRPINQMVGRNSQGHFGQSQQELSPNSPLLRSISAGESALPGTRYYSFGGVDVSLVRLYAMVYDAMSAVPQYKCSASWSGASCKQYFVWHGNPNEIAPMSPILDKFGALVPLPEMHKGVGDVVVTDQSARLPAMFSAIHVTNPLNHFEVLWNRPLMSQVAGLFA